MKNRNHLLLIIGCSIMMVMIIMSLSDISYAGSRIRVLSAEIEGAISPAKVALLEDILEQADDDNHDIVLLRIDTPGGLGSSMRELVKMMMNSHRPICVWVGPEGAQAASAGTFLVAASDVAAMAPGTTIGAASPVSSSGDDLPETMSTKLKNDMSSLIKGIARERGRNFEWYVSAVKEGVSLDAQEAAALNVVNYVALSGDDLLEQLGARGIEINGQVTKFSFTDVDIDHFEPGLRHSVLSWLLDPQVAYFLLIGGILGLFFELSHPGTLLPGVIGGFCFLTALYAFSILPTNAAGLLLLLFGAVLFILEAFIVSYGLLSISALISLFVGSLILFRGEEVEQIPLQSILGTIAVFSVFAGGIIYLVAKSQVRKTRTGIDSMVGLEGNVIKVDDGRIKIRVRGEIWNAVAQQGESFSSGDRVIVVRADGLTLKITNKS